VLYDIAESYAEGHSKGFKSATQITR